VPEEQGYFIQEQDNPGQIPAVFLLQNVLQLHQQRSVILCVDSFALWNIINEQNYLLIPKKSRWKVSSGYLHSEFLWPGEPL
jgi:hypothetical protein